MKRKLFLFPALLFALTSLSGCNNEEFYDLKVYNKDELILKSKISIFNNAILPTVDPSSYEDGKIFVGFGVKEFIPHVSRKNDFYQEKDLVRLVDVRPYAVNHTINLRTIYCNEGELANYYLVLGWYAKTNTSGLDENIINGFKPLLTNYLKDTLHANSSQLANVDIRAYDGDVSTIGANINFDGDVNIFIGAAGNLATTGNVAYTSRASFPVKGVTDRLIYLINNSTVAESVYNFMRSKTVRDYFGG